MSKKSVTFATLLALVIATIPIRAADRVSAAQESMKKSAPRLQFTKRGQPLTALELKQLEFHSAQFASRYQHAGGAEASTETIILATIGALVLIGAIIAVAAKDDENGE
jgi:hypothetical protein